MSQNVPVDEFNTEWANYGDASPEEHGGRFVKWDTDHWLIVETNRADAVMPDGDPGTQVVDKYWVYPDDVWVDGDPSEGFTDDMESILESLDAENHKEAPGGQPFIDRIAYYVADMSHYLDSDYDFVEYDDYDDVVAQYGVDSYDD